MDYFVDYNMLMEMSIMLHIGPSQGRIQKKKEGEGQATDVLLPQ